MNKPTLTILVGLSGGGKSTIATQLAKNNYNTVIVSSDAIRKELTGNYENQEHNEEVFKIFHERIRRNVIADATNITMKSRRAIMQKINGLDIYKICYIIPKSFEQCKIDNKNREHPVPDEVLDKQIRRFQIPFYNEGFDKIVIKNFHEKPISLRLISQMNAFDQKTPYHNKTLGEHCLFTVKLFEKYNYPKYYTLAGIYHDIGKLFTQSFDEKGIVHYFGHAEYSAYLFLSKFYDVFYDISDDEFLNVCFLINYHMIPFYWDNATDRAKQRWKERFGEYKYKMLLDFHECDIAR